MRPRDYLEPGRVFRMALASFLGVLAIYLEAAPLGIATGAPPSPDLLLCVVAYWSIRRPGSMPMLLVFILGLMRDLLTDVPVGAGVLTLILASEGFKVWRRHLQRTMFLTEWLSVGAVALASAALMWILVVMTFAQPPYLVALLHQCLYTAMVYPILVVILRWGLRVSWSRPEPAQ